MPAWLGNFLFECVNLLLLAAALGWFVFKPVRAALEREQARQRKELDEARKLRDEAQALAESTRKAQAAAERESEERRKQELAAQRAESERQRAEAQGEIDAQRHALEHELEARRREATVELAADVGRLAANSLRRLLEGLEGPELDAALVRGACDELRRLDGAKRGDVAVESARALAASERDQLRVALGREFEARVVPELGAGVRVTTPAGQVDASAVALARHAAHELAESVVKVGQHA